MSNSLIINGDSRHIPLPDGCVQACITSPPYFGLRRYLPEGDELAAHEIGLEQSPAEYVAQMVQVFNEVRRVLRDDGVCWLNIGDSYAGSGKGGLQPVGATGQRKGRGNDGLQMTSGYIEGYKEKNLFGIPWRVAFALQDAGWYLRSDIIWAKPNPMPESVTDRPTKAHEYVFLLTKSARYFYDADAVAEPTNYPTGTREDAPKGSFNGKNGDGAFRAIRDMRNLRSVWTIATQPYSGAHFATMPPELARRCIKAGSKAGDLILDPFNGSGTTGRVALELGRRYVGVELNRDYIELSQERQTVTLGMGW